MSFNGSDNDDNDDDDDDDDDVAAEEESVISSYIQSLYCLEPRAKRFVSPPISSNHHPIFFVCGVTPPSFLVDVWNENIFLVSLPSVAVRASAFSCFDVERKFLTVK